MILFCWCIVSLCLSVNSESVIMYKDAGGTVTLKCSSEKCPQLSTGYFGMHVYLEHTGREEVLYYDNRSTDKITPRQRYRGRIQKTGSFLNHCITINNLTVNDTGLYSCVYAKSVQHEVKCNVYAVIITAPQRQKKGLAPSTSHEPESPERTGPTSCSTTAEEKSPALLIITAACIAAAVVSMLLTLVFILVVWPRVQQCRRSRRIARNTQPVSNDYVYEVMTKNGFHPDAAQEDSSPYEFVASQTSSSRGLV